MMEALPLMVLLLLFAISNIELVGGDPKPQHLERTRVVGLKNYSKNHRRHEKAGGSGGSERKPNPDNNQVEDASDENFRLWDDGPNFDTNLQQNVVSLVDRTAYLTCRVFDRGNKTVSWIRHHDLHILTVGSYTYTADLRFRSIYNSRKDEWVLQIQYVQKRDAGRYECQINTQPVRSYFVQLQVVDTLPENELLKMNDARSTYKGGTKEQRQKEGFFAQGEIPVASILGNPQVFIESGSVLNLTCVVKQAITKPAFIIWRHGTKTIDYSSPRGGISVETNTSGNTPTSYLLIDAVAPSDSGKYSCHPANAQEISVNVQVQEGEHQAAIHTNKASRQSAGGLVLLLP
eukprot:15032.XXX_554819_578580_1 [CDS] Oithona nana genome sequencing.